MATPGRPTLITSLDVGGVDRMELIFPDRAPVTIILDKVSLGRATGRRRAKLVVKADLSVIIRRYASAPEGRPAS